MHDLDIKISQNVVLSVMVKVMFKPASSPFHEQEMHSTVCNDDERTRKDTQPDHVLPHGEIVEPECT